jgi:hypothetical protein
VCGQWLEGSFALGILRFTYRSIVETSPLREYRLAVVRLAGRAVENGIFFDIAQVLLEAVPENLVRVVDNQHRTRLRHEIHLMHVRVLDRVFDPTDDEVREPIVTSLRDVAEVVQVSKVDVLVVWILCYQLSGPRGAVIVNEGSRGDHRRHCQANHDAFLK